MAGYEIRSIRKAVAVLRAFPAETPELGVTEVARIVGLNRSVVQKIVITLEREGLLRQLPGSRRYQIGPGVLELAGTWLKGNPLVREGTLPLSELVRESGMSGGLGVLDREEVLYLVAMEAEVGLKAASRVGDRRPLHATATGKCILAFLPEREREALLRRIQFMPLTARTITDPEAIRRELVVISERGYSLTRGERVAGLAGVAAPVWDHCDHVVAAISLGIPESLFADETLDRCIRLTLDAARRLSARLGSGRAADAPTDTLDLETTRSVDRAEGDSAMRGYIARGAARKQSETGAES